ncbi:C-terminal binding protein [SAR86 cluster bacterium]|nr:C-terminal binding protein [SAR86 cluster bacterium]
MPVFITDYVEKPDIESKVLSGRLTKEKKEAEVLLVWHQEITKEYLSKFPNLKGVVRYGVGYDAIDLAAVRERNIYFCNTPDYGTDEVSDTVIGMIMMLTRGIHFYDQHSRNFKNKKWQENTINSLQRTSSLSLGVIGAGRIGGSIIRKAKAIGFKTTFYDPYKEPGYEKMLDTNRSLSLDEILKTSNIISINTPLTPETKGMVNKDFLDQMLIGSVLINAARGEILESLDILIEPLKQNLLFGVSLDVLPEEPPINCELIKAWKKNEDWIKGKLIINPHTSYYSKESYFEMRQKSAENAKRILENKEPLNKIVDKKK